MATAYFDDIDELTLRRARNGDGAAFASLYDRYAKPAYNLALRMLGDGAAAEDVVQEVFLRLLDRLRGYRGDAPFGAWLRRLVANAAIDELRRRRWLESEAEIPVAQFPQTRSLAEDQAEAWQALMELSPAARAVVVLHEIEGYTHVELAAMFGQSESYSKSILSRALARLRERMQLNEHRTGDAAHVAI
jgi:RNA polymerase sigma factor (sigma-70 family)